MKHLGAFLTLLLASSTISILAVEPLLARNKNYEVVDSKSFMFQSTSGKAYPISNKGMAYPATLIISGEWIENRNKKLANVGELRITDGSLTIDTDYYAAKVYKIIKGFGIYNEKNGKLKILCEVHELIIEPTYRLVLQGKRNADGTSFEAPESRIASQYFVEFSGQLTK